MARIRSIKPEMRISRTCAEWPRDVRYAWVLLWGYLDDYGRGVDDIRTLKADLFPLDDDVTNRKLDGWLTLMTQRTRWTQDDRDPPLCRYRVGGIEYLHAVYWTEHQRVSHPGASRIPACPHHDDKGGRRPGPLPNPSGIIPEENQNGSRPEPEPIETGAGTIPPRAGVAGSREKGAEEKGAGSRVAAEPRDDVERICQHLADRIAGNGSRRPTITAAWRDSARLLLDRDQRTEAQVHTAIDWCQDDTFWRGNVLSLPKLRDKYDQLRLQAQRGPGASTKPPPVAGDPYLNDIRAGVYDPPDTQPLHIVPALEA